MILGTIFESGISVQFYIVLSTILFAIGVIGVLVRRNAIIVLMSVELMLNSVNLLLVAFSTYFGDGDAQIFVFFIMVVAAAEVPADAVPAADAAAKPAAKGKGKK